MSEAVPVCPVCKCEITKYDRTARGTILWPCGCLVDPATVQFHPPKKQEGRVIQTVNTLLTLRQEYAKAAMLGMLANPKVPDVFKPDLYFQMADAMIEFEKNEKKQSN